LQVRLNKWLNELEQMFYGMAFAFDKSLSGNDVITGALLRNFYNDDKSQQKPAEVLSRYVTRLVILCIAIINLHSFALTACLTFPCDTRLIKSNTVSMPSDASDQYSTDCVSLMCMSCCMDSGKESIDPCSMYSSSVAWLMAYHV